jgi:ribosomal protein L37AE/L43A
MLRRLIAWFRGACPDCTGTLTLYGYGSGAWSCLRCDFPPNGHPVLRRDTGASHE